MKTWALSMEGTLASMQAKLAEKVVKTMPSLKAKKAMRVAKDLYTSGLAHVGEAKRAAAKTVQLKKQLQRMQVKNARALKVAEKQLNAGLPGYPKLPDGSDFVPSTMAIAHTAATVAKAKAFLQDAAVPKAVPVQEGGKPTSAGGVPVKR